MAIKINNTTVINDSRGLTYITSIDSTTAASIQAGGVGAAATTPTLSGSSSLPTFLNTYTLTVSNFSSYTVPLFFYSVVDNGGTAVGTGNFTTSSVDIPLSHFSGTAPWTVKVLAGDVSKLFSTAATKSVSDVAGITARYWRIGVTPNEGVAEWRLYTGRNQTGTDVNVSSFLGSYAGYSGYPRSSAHDGSQSSMWWSLSGTSGQGSNTLIFDLGSAQTIKSMAFANFGGGPSYALGEFTTAGCTVASSTDNVTYTNRLTGIITTDGDYPYSAMKVYGT